MSIEIKNLYKKYGDLRVLEDFHISFEENKISCLLGPSGCGKTTLLNILSGIEGYDKGTILGLKDKTFSYIFQEDRLLPWSNVEENIRFVLRNKYNLNEINNVVNKYLDIVQLEKYRNYYPNQLSGGMKRRVSIARAFAYPSDILLMDEPFKGLDINLKNNLINSFISLWKKDKRTVIFVTHDINEANMLADDILEL